MSVAVIFDLDGTLVDSAAAIRDIANILMGELALRPLDLAEARSYIGNGASRFLERALDARDARDAATFNTLLHRFEELYATAPGEANVPYAGVTATLKALAEADHRLALCTNKPKLPTDVVLAAHGWQDLFNAVVTGDTLAEKKPHPAPLLAAARALGEGRVVYVGDSEVDAETAATAGIPLLLHVAGYRKSPVEALTHAAVFERFPELPGLVERHAAPVAADA